MKRKFVKGKELPTTDPTSNHMSSGAPSPRVTLLPDPRAYVIFGLGRLWQERRPQLKTMHQIRLYECLGAGALAAQIRDELLTVVSCDFMGTVADKNWAQAVNAVEKRRHCL